MRILSFIAVILLFLACQKDVEVINVFVEGKVTLLDEFGDSTVIAQSGVTVRGSNKKAVTDQYGNFSIGNVDKARKLYFKKSYYQDLVIDLSNVEEDYIELNEAMFHKPVTWIHDFVVQYEEVDNSGYFELSFLGKLTPFDEHIQRRTFEVFIDNTPNVGPDRHVMSFEFTADVENQEFILSAPLPVNFYNQGIDNYLYAVAYGKSSFMHEGYPVVMYNNRSNLYEFIPH